MRVSADQTKLNELCEMIDENESMHKQSISNQKKPENKTNSAADLIGRCVWLIDLMGIVGIVAILSMDSSQNKSSPKNPNLAIDSPSLSNYSFKPITNFSIDLQWQPIYQINPIDNQSLLSKGIQYWETLLSYKKSLTTFVVSTIAMATRNFIPKRVFSQDDLNKNFIQWIQTKPFSHLATDPYSFLKKFSSAPTFKMVGKNKGF